MKLFSFCCLLGIALASVQGTFLERGKEFEYDVQVMVGAGTMDYAPHTGGNVLKFTMKLQTTSETTLTGKLESAKLAEYVGPIDTRNVASDGLSFTDAPLNTEFTIYLNDGIITSIKTDSSLSLAQENIIKGFLSNFQLKSKTIAAGIMSFKSKEQTIHGMCDISYTVTGDSIYKTMSLDTDCPDRPVRRVDDIRGYDCERDDENKAAGFVSTSSSTFTYEKSGSAFKITSVRSTGAFVAQMFDTEGVSYIAVTNMTAELTDTRNNPGGIGGGSKMTSTLAYTFTDSEYDYDIDRDLKATEPFFGTGPLLGKATASVLKKTLLTFISAQKEILKGHDNSKETLEKAHNYGVDKISPIMSAMNYNQLMSVYNQLAGDKSEDGVQKTNIFTELLGSTGTSASAMVVKDLIMNQKFDNCRDAVRILVAIPFHIKRPNKQLVQEFEALMDADTGCEYINRAAPMVVGHMIQRTCRKAGEHKKNSYGAMKTCAKTFAHGYVKKFYNKFVDANNRQDKNMYLSAITNIKWGGVADILQPLIDGSSGESSEFRSFAMWSALAENFVLNKVFERYFPVFAEKRNDHEVRINALGVLLSKTPTVTNMAQIISVLRSETDLEIINFIYTKLESMATSVSPCDAKGKEVAGYFLKLLKQFSKYKASYRFGISKTYSRQFNKKKYGYSGQYTFTIIGSHESTTPLTVGMGISSTLHNNYKSQDLFVHLRIEGLAKSLVRKFKSMDPSVFRTEKLIKILKDEMGIFARPDQPVRVGYAVCFKGVVAFGGSVEMNDAQGGNAEELMKTFKGIGKSINHQRILNPIALMVEQPTDLGIPAFYATSVTGMFHLTATAERKQAQGMLLVEAKYDAHLLIQGRNMMMVTIPKGQVYQSQMVYGIVQDRVYHMHAPREITAGVNPLRKEVKIAISRPEKEHPNFFMMHAETAVVAQSISEPAPPTKKVIVSRGADQVKARTVFNVDNSKFGAAAKFEYFDCEMDIQRSNTVSRFLYAFAPFNKNPSTPYTSMVMGTRQITSFLMLFPRAERCGIFFGYSQSSENPVRRVELSVRGGSEPKGEKLFLRGSKLSVKAKLLAIGDVTRAYRMTFVSDTTPGGLTQKTKVELDRARVSSMGIEPYKICLAYFAKYPKFSREMFDVDLNSDMKMAGKAMLQYGPVESCGDATGVVNVAFEYSTTAEARENLKKKTYYKECMAKKNSPAMRQKKGLPLSFPCMRTAFDASSARKYKFDVKFKKMTDRLRNFISTAKSVAKAVALPLGIDELAAIDANEVGDFVNFEATLKDDDSKADVVIQTSSGKREINDYPLRLDYTRSLRNLQFTSPAERLFRMGILKPCQITSDTIYTLDNVTLNYDIPRCYTLASGHCSNSPSYAVFIKKNAGKLPMAMKAYIGGYAIDIDPASGKVTVDGRRVRVTDDKEYFKKVQKKEVFKITKWGQTYNIYSFLKVWIVFDGNYVNVVPAPSVKGQHCGLCGNYNSHQGLRDEMTGKDGKTNFYSVSNFVNDYKYKC